MIDTNASTDVYPRDVNHVTGSRRVTRHSIICQDIQINKGGSRKKSIADYFPNIDQPVTCKIANYKNLPGDSEKILKNQSTYTISSSSSHSKLSKKIILKLGTSENIQNDSCKKTLTLANFSLQNFLHFGSFLGFFQFSLLFELNKLFIYPSFFPFFYNFF